MNLFVVQRWTFKNIYLYPQHDTVITLHMIKFTTKT
jgi:hypothetical protein